MELFNTLSRKKEKFKALKEGTVTMYTCGPTVYNYAHIGNLRTFIFYDIVKRAFELDGYKVKQVMNITDVDDKTIKSAAERRMSLKEYTDIYTKYFMDDLEKLNVEKNIKFTKATENIDKMQLIIKKLLKTGYAYEADDGIYYKVSAFEAYGRLSGMTVDGKYSRIKGDEYDKESATDFALWKYWDAKDGEVYWDGELKKGRPGWHIECSAMAIKHLAKTIDVHCGGVDLMFPHHENEIAQSEAYTGEKFVNYWVHCEHLLVNNQKMSKSLGNFYTLKDLEGRGFDPLSFRLMVLDNNYRNRLDFTFDNLKKYEGLLKKIDLSMKSLEKIKRYTEKNNELSKQQVNETVKKLLEDFKEAVNNDFNTHSALVAFFALLDLSDSRVEKGRIDSSEYKVLKDGIDKMQNFIGVYRDYEIPKEILEMADKRKALREESKFTEADIMRNRIKEKGYFIADLRDSYVIIKNYLEH